MVIQPAHATRSEGLLERMLERLRLSERLKLPPKSISILPVMTHFDILKIDLWELYAHWRKLWLTLQDPH